jgi:hypothetical protein
MSTSIHPRTRLFAILRILGILGAIVQMLAASQMACAQGTLAKLIPFRQQKVDADPAKQYWVTDDSGPWMVMAYSFAGEDGELDAHKLVLELRRDFGLEAYVHRQQFDPAAEMKDVKMLGVDKMGNPKRAKAFSASKYNEYVVLVGDYPAVDDPKCQAAIKRVRTLQPKSLGGVGDSGNKVRTARQGLVGQAIATTGVKVPTSIGPMYKAFATRNPKLSSDPVAQKSMDPFVKALNSESDFSLLKNPGKYTITVATFRGATSFREDDFERLTTGKKANKLVVAGNNAVNLAKALRAKGFEAYEFHDRFESIVTVGSFNDLGKTDANGKTELTPAIAKIIKTFESKKVPIPDRPGELACVPQQVDGIMMDVSPQIIRVPKESVADQYQP